MTYKDFLESEIYNFDINWEEKRKYILELTIIDYISKGGKFLNPLNEKDQRSI